MSSSDRALNRFRRERDPFDNDDALLCARLAVVYDRDDDDAHMLARQTTHDDVIALAGTARISGVRWTEIDGTHLERIEEYLRVGMNTPAAADVDVEAELQTCLAALRDNPRSLLVIAEVVVTQARHTVGLS